MVQSAAVQQHQYFWQLILELQSDLRELIMSILPRLHQKRLNHEPAEFITK